MTTAPAISVSNLPVAVPKHSYREDSVPCRTLRKEISLRMVNWYSNRHALRNTRERNVRSKIRWFTEFCNSHYFSQFAAFFIDARAKRSIVKSCIFICKMKFSQINKTFVCLVLVKTLADRKTRHISPRTFHSLPKHTSTVHSVVGNWIITFVNDPSAGSPTETLLRLLLPLNDQVWPTSQQLAAVASCQTPIRRSH